MDETSATVEFDRAGTSLTAYLAGELDEDSAPPLTGMIISHIRTGDTTVRLDLSGVTFCGSAGIRMFLHLGQFSRGMGTRIRLYNPAPNVERVLEVCHLSENLSLWNEPDQATPA